MLAKFPSAGVQGAAEVYAVMVDGIGIHNNQNPPCGLTEAQGAHDN